MRFNGRVVIVTGGSKGIGAGCSEVFCREGGLVAILSRGSEAGESLARSLTQQGPGRAVYIPCDVSDMSQLESGIARAASVFGRVDCLINNAGWHPPATSLADTSLEEMEALMRLNYTSTFAASKFALPHLLKTRGTIINIASIVAVIGQHHAAAYCATKGAQIGFTKGLAVELGPLGVRVNAILPGNIETPLMHEWADSLENPKSALESQAKLQLFGRLGTAEEMGKLALFLATDDSSFLTGQAIEAEGGATLDY